MEFKNTKTDYVENTQSKLDELLKYHSSTPSYRLLDQRSNYGLNPFMASSLDFITRDLCKNENHDPLNSYLAGKSRFLRSMAEDFLGLIFEREHLMYENLRGIDYDFCQMKERLFLFEGFYHGGNPSIDRIRSSLESDLAGLEKEKRMERVSCWRDVARLRSELREVLKELEQEKRRENLLGDG